MAEVTQMPPTESPEIADSPAEIASPKTTSTPSRGPSGKNKGGRPTKGQEKPMEATSMEFFSRVAAVPQQDWGTRAYMYVYADEPICKAKTFGEKRFMLKSSKPILDLQQLKEDYGSFAGWMTLNLRKTGKDQTDEVDRFNFEIYDPKFPPKIPRIAWVNDDRNKRWEALLPPEPPPPNAAATSLMDSIKVYKEIRDEVREEREEPEPQFDQTRSTLETMKLAKELFAPASTSNSNSDKPADPFDTAKKIMDMRANDPMVTLLLARMDAQDKAAEEARKREYDLMKELRQKEAAPATAPKTLLDQVGELLGPETVKKFIGDLITGKGPGEAIVRTGRVTGLEVARDIAGKLLDSDLASGIGQWLAAKAQQSVNPATPGMNGPPAQNGVQQPAPQDFNAFLRDVLNPALMRHYAQGFSGAEFAGWLYDGYPDRLKELQNFTHPLAPGQRGAPVIVAGYKRTAHMWPTLSVRGEQAFVDFVNEFCAWKPDSQASDATDAEVDDGQPIDLDEPEEGRAS